MQPKRPEVGDVVEDVELPDETARPRRFSELAVGGALVLVFYRGDW